jgi:hypothetical protein
MSAGTTSPASPKRRWLLKSALAVAAVGGAIGGGVWWRRGFDKQHITQDGKVVFRALARGIVGPMLPTDPAQREAVLDNYLVKLEGLLASMPSAKRDQVSLLIGALANAPTRYMITSRWSSWDTATDDEVRALMLHLRQSGGMVQSMTYIATRAITCMGFFSIPDNWALTGYPGPMAI